MTSLGEKIKTARESVNLSQAELAERMGFARNADGAISKWESGEREPKLGNIIKLANALEMNAGEMFGGFIVDTSPPWKSEKERRAALISGSKSIRRGKKK